ncbi:hypothetical protein imdm_1577 [gamma proteobacterium IMCC2047]|nr:hypothetical protein imdm_1577 [gamma proteobacterium IMCC2047]
MGWEKMRVGMISRAAAFNFKPVKSIYFLATQSRAVIKYLFISDDRKELCVGLLVFT